MERPNVCPRTDLASEAREFLSGDIPGVYCSEKRSGEIRVTRVEIKSEDAAKAIGKSRGIYVTAETGRVWADPSPVFEGKVKELALLLREIAEEAAAGSSSVLVAGLGNRFVTADAVGPACVDHVIVTRHIKNTTPYVYENLGLFDVAAISPGVLGQTGIESADIVKSVAKSVSPSLLVVIDSLAARRPDRLASTVQISTGGISPGSGVGNLRSAIDSSSVGVPVISVGVPTVVEAATLIYDISSELSETPIGYERIKKHLSQNGLDYFVAPKESDAVTKKVAKLIGYAINLAFNKDLEYDEMVSLCE